MSANCDVDVAMRGLENEARYLLMKPVSVGEVKNTWQPIIQKYKENENDIEEIGSFGEIRQAGSSSEENDNPNAAGGWGSPVDHLELERHKGKKGALGVRIDAKGKKVKTAERKAHIHWDAVLHNNFVKSIDQIGSDSKKIHFWLKHLYSFLLLVHCCNLYCTTIVLSLPVFVAFMALGAFCPCSLLFYLDTNLPLSYIKILQ